MPTPETVRFFIKDQLGAALPGVLVRVFDSGGAFVSSDVSTIVGPDAIADFTLDGDPDPNPINYTARFSKTGISFDGLSGDDNKSPQQFDVFSPASGSPTGTNDFNIEGETHIIPTATDPRLCRCSAFFKDITGRPLAGLDMHVKNIFRPAIVDGEGVMGEGVFLRTDKDGFAQIDLYRNGKYTFLVQSSETVDDPNLQGAIVFPRVVVVPDQSSFNLVILLFPVVESIAFTPAGPFTMSVGDVLNVVPVVTASDQRVLEGLATADVLYSVEDNGVLALGIGEEELTITAVEPGTSELRAERKDNSIVRIPDTDIVGVPIAITVT